MEPRQKYSRWAASLVSKRWFGYAVAVCSTLLAALLRWAIGLKVGQIPPFITFYPAVIAAATMGGTGSGILATLLSTLTADFFFMEPTGRLGPITPTYAVQVALFASINIALSLIGGRLRRAHQATRASEVRYRRLFEAAHDGVLLLDPTTHRITDANPFITQLLGYSHEELLHKELWQIGLLKDADASRDALARLAREGIIRYDDLPLQGKTGETHEVEFVSSLYDEDGRSVIQCNIRDISARKQAEEALHQSEERFRTLFNAIDEGFCIVEVLFDRHHNPIDYRYLHMNPACARHTAGPIVPGQTARELTPDLEDYWPQLLGRVALTGQPTRYQHPVAAWQRWYEGYAFSLGPRDKHQVGILFSDITARKQVEEALREQSCLAKLRADVVQILQEQAPPRTLLQRVAAQLVQGLDAAFARVWTLDTAGQTLELQASAGLYTHLDGPHSRVPVGQLKIGRIAQERRPLFTNQVLGDPNIPCQDWARHEGLVAFAGFPLLLDERLIGVVALFARHPLSTAAIESFGTIASSLAQGLGRLLAEQALRSSEARLSQAVLVGRLGTFDHDLISGEIHCSPQLREILGLAADESLCLSALLERVRPEDRQRTAEAIRRGHDPSGDGLIEIEYPVAVPGRGTRWMSVRAQTIFDGQGPARHAVRTIGAVLDITEQKEFTVRLERTIQERTSKLRETVAELEGFSYSLVHDMRAPLRAMLAYAGILELEAGERFDPEHSDLLRKIKLAALRMDQLVTDSLNYSKILRQDLPIGPVNLAKLIRGMVETYPNLQPPHADIAVELPDLIVQGNPAALTQVFSNLLGNAVKFVAPGVHPRVRVWAQFPNPPPSSRSTPEGEGQTKQAPPSGIAHHAPLHQPNNPASYQSRVLIWVEDNGIGIPKDQRERIFGMFQRLHRPDEYSGTGIGLTLVRKSLDRTGGQICLDSEPGKGSRFCVQLPLAPPAQTAADIAGPA